MSFLCNGNIICSNNFEVISLGFDLHTKLILLFSTKNIDFNMTEVLILSFSFPHQGVPKA